MELKYPDDYINKILNMDCLEAMRQMPDDSIDSCITDPPYEISFMGKSWDNTGIAYNVEMWKECLRVLKPGGHLLAFGGTRTYHRMAYAIENAGFEVRDMIEWVYGSGFPKSLNISKALDKKKNINEEIIRKYLRENLKDIEKNKIAKVCDVSVRQVDHWIKKDESQPQVPSKEKWEILAKIYNLQNRPQINWDNLGEIVGVVKSPITWNKGDRLRRKATTSEAKQWEGWGTALKPSHEPICLARKPLSEKSVTENVLKWGTGGLNIDESRVVGEPWVRDNTKGKAEMYDGWGMKPNIKENKTGGRFPANLIHDNSPEVRGCFPESSITGKRSQTSINNCIEARKVNKGNSQCDVGGNIEKITEYTDSGNASRFFKSIAYYPKASRSERNKGCENMDKQITSDGRKKPIDNAFQLAETLRHNNHPCVKPIALMEYLIKMITPKGGIVLDPFAGSGSTLIAAKQNGFNFIGIEKVFEYIEIAEARLKAIPQKLL